MKIIYQVREPWIIYKVNLFWSFENFIPPSPTTNNDCLLISRNIASPSISDSMWQAKYCSPSSMSNLPDLFPRSTVYNGVCIRLIKQMLDENKFSIKFSVKKFGKQMLGMGAFALLTPTFWAYFFPTLVGCNVN